MTFFDLPIKLTPANFDLPVKKSTKKVYDRQNNITDFYLKKMFRKKIDETLKESSSAMTRCEILCFISFCRFYPKFPNKSDKFIYLLTIYKNPFCIFNLS